jgi:hypothetical protein
MERYLGDERSRIQAGAFFLLFASSWMYVATSEIARTAGESTFWWVTRFPVAGFAATVGVALMVAASRAEAKRRRTEVDRQAEQPQVHGVAA